jgi:predicted membrane channel-forming protein YqfA (hemolysin III family)
MCLERAIRGDIMMSIYWPQTLGETLGFTVAAITLLIGLAGLLFPRTMLRLVKLVPVVPEAVAEGRAGFGGMLLALGACAILFAQPFVTLVMGAMWLAAAAGRLISIVFDSAASRFNAAALAFETAMGLAALAGVLGWVV